jgi:hypothetical protein
MSRCWLESCPLVLFYMVTYPWDKCYFERANVEGVLSIIELLHVCGELSHADFITKGGFSKCFIMPN